MKILLHICCGPCGIYPLEKLKEQGFEVAGLFYNPNIHPYSEYLKRREAVEGFAKETSLDVAYPEYQPQEYFDAISHEKNPPERCFLCWGLRMKKAAVAAKEKGLDAFTSTLLVSPFQDQDALKRIGEAIDRETGIRFHFEDFRPGFRKAHVRAKEKGMYCQKYCGCLYSEIERCMRSQKR